MLEDSLVRISKANSCLETLQAPGCGILSVSTTIANPQKMLGKYFGKDAYTKKWKGKIQNPEQPIIIGYPCDTGAGIVRGSAYGPVFLRQQLYKKNPLLSVNDLGDVPVIPQLLHDSMLSKKQISSSQKYLYAKFKGPVSPLSVLENTLIEVIQQNPKSKTFVLGGDHSTAGAVMRAYKKTGRTKNLALLQIDAHTDLLEDRFGVEHCFATWTANSLPYFKNPKALVQIGLRASAKSKSHWEKTFGLKQHWAKELKRKSPLKFADRLLKHWEKLNCDKLYISNDIDGTDAMQAPCTGTPEKSGLESKWICDLLKEISTRIEVVGMDMVEVAPVLHSKREQKQTLRCAVDQILSVKW